MASTIKDAMENAKVPATPKAKAKATPKAKGSDKAEALAKTVSATWQGAMSDVLTGITSSAHKTVQERTARILHTLQQSSHNWFAIGQDLIEIANAVNAQQFARLIKEVFSRFGLSQPTIYRWMSNVEVLEKALPYEPARDAILTVFNGTGLVVRADGEASMNGAVASGLKKHPMPTTGSYNDCLDWARLIQLVAEKAEGQTKTSMEEFSKAIRNRFDKLLKKRYDLAVEVLVYCYRHLEAVSEPLAQVALEAIEDSSISPDAAGKNGLRVIKELQARGDSKAVAA